MSNLQPRRTELKEFSGNTAHSCFLGFDINDGLTANHGLRTNVGFITENPFVIEGFNVFSNRLSLYAGIGGGGGGISFRENIIFDNLTSSDARNHTMFATRATVQNAIFISDTDNGLLNSNDQRSMNVLYDGALRIYDSYFVDFNRNNSSVFENTGAGTKIINHMFRGITYNHDGPPRVNIIEGREPVNNERNNTCVQAWSNVIMDLDGSLTRTGTPSTLVTDTDFYVFDEAYQPYNWEGLHSVKSKFVLIRSTNDVPVKITRKDLTCGASKFLSSGACNVGPNSNFHLALDDDKYEHALYYSNLLGNNMVINVNSEYEGGKALTIRYKGFGRLNNTRIDGITEKNSIAQVQNSNTTAYYVEPNGDMYVKFITTNSFLGKSYTVRWNSGSLPNFNEYNEEPNLMNAYVNTSNQSGCNARATFHIRNNPNRTQLEISLDGGENYTETINDNVGSVNFNNVPVGTLIYARWPGQNCGIPINFVRNYNRNATCDDSGVNVAPSVIITEPVADTTELEVGSDLGVLVDANDIDGSIANVKLYLNDELVRQENVAPYEWGAANNTVQDPLLLNLAVGTYEVKAVATDNSGATTTTIKTVIVVDGSLSVDDIEEQNVIKLHPNPVTSALFISGDTLGKRVQVYNTLGAVMFSKELTEAENSIDMRTLSSGLYLVKVIDPNTNSKTKTFKVIKTN